MRVEAELAEMRQSVEAGWQVNEDRRSLLVKAYRAKTFGRCPSCDARGLSMWEELGRWGWQIICRSCGCETFLTYLDSARGDDPWLEVAERAR